MTLWRIQSIGILSATALVLRKTPTARLTFTSRKPLQQAMNPTGYRRPRANSYSGCACICPVRPFSTAPTRCRQSLKCNDMNRLILRYRYPLTFAILAILVWVVYRRFSAGSGLITLAVAAVIVWGLGTFLFIYFW